MLASLDAAVSGLDAFQQDMNIIGNNIANVNTTGFKSSRADLGNSFSNTLSTAMSGTAPNQIGTGVAIDSITTDWSQSALTQGGAPGDVAINGAGFFTVTDSVSGQTYATQAGNFSLDGAGFLTITGTNLRVQGYTDSTHTTIGDIQVSGTGGSYAVDVNGNVTGVPLGASSASNFGQILLQTYQDPEALVSASGNLYSNTANAGGLATAGAPGSNNTGYLSPGSLESSNVDLSGQMADLIIAQRGFEANSKIITASDEMLSTVVNMVR